MGRGVQHGWCLSPFLSNLPSKCSTIKALERFGGLKVGGQVIHTVKYVDELLLLATEEMVLHGMIDWLIEIGSAMEWK